MDFVVLLLLLTKYFGLYWLFDYKVDYEYPARQLELTLGLAVGHLLLYSGYALLTGDYFVELVPHLLLYVVAITLEGGLWLFYDNIFTLLSKHEYQKTKYYRVGNVDLIDRRIIRIFNGTYLFALLSTFFSIK